MGGVGRETSMIGWSPAEIYLCRIRYHLIRHLESQKEAQTHSIVYYFTSLTSDIEYYCSTRCGGGC